MTRKLGLAAAFVLSLACGTDDSTPLADEPERALTSLDYRIFVRGVGFADPASAQAFTSAADGTLVMVTIDDPPLVVGSLAVERLELRVAGRLVAALPRGEWTFLARRSASGHVDAVWTANDMPPEVERLTRFVLGELQTPAAELETALEETPAGTLDARQHRFSGLGLNGTVRLRTGASVLASGGSVCLGDGFGAIALASGLVTESALLGEDHLVSGNFMLAVRDSATPVDDEVKLADLREQIEALSVYQPAAMVEPAQTDEQRAALRRAAESWKSVKNRLVSVAADVDPVLVSRAAAHLSADDALARELQELACTPSTTKAAATAMHAALGDCGTRACQQALIAIVNCGVPLGPDVLAAFTRVREPSAETVDFLVGFAVDADEAARSGIGIVLSHFADVDPTGAGVRTKRLLGGVEQCGPELDGWFGLLGNAGLSTTKPLLLGCLDAEIPVKRRASAVGALRRIPGADVTEVLVRYARDDAEDRTRLACLRALGSRDVQDAELTPLLRAEFDAWSRPSLNALLDVLEHVALPSGSVAELLRRLSRSEHEDIAERARLALETRRSDHP